MSPEMSELVKRSAREMNARAALVDAATEVASIIGGEPEPTDELGSELALALGILYRCNDEWQEAQVSAALPLKRRRLKRRRRAAPRAKRAGGSRG